MLSSVPISPVYRFFRPNLWPLIFDQSHVHDIFGDKILKWHNINKKKHKSSTLATERFRGPPEWQSELRTSNIRRPPRCLTHIRCAYFSSNVWEVAWSVLSKNWAFTFLSDLSPIIVYPCYNSLTNSLLFSKLYWCDPGVWRWQLKTCWGCCCCYCWF